MLVEHTSAITDFEAIEEDPAIDEQYRQEMGELLKRVTGADLAWMIGGGKKMPKAKLGASTSGAKSPLLKGV